MMDDECSAETTVKKQIRTLVQRFRDVGLDVNSSKVYDAKISTAMLFYAAMCGNKDILQFLVHNSRDGNIMNLDDFEALHIATRNSHMQIVQTLDNFEIKNFGQTTLHHACTIGHLVLVKYLVRNQCNINATDSNGVTPLHFATSPDVFEFLVESGADLDCRDTDGWAVLHWACFMYNGWADIVKCIIRKGCNPNAQTISGETPLHFVCDSHASWIEIIEDLLSAGADFNLEDEEGNSPFSLFLVSRRCLEGITVFLKNGAYFQYKDYNFIIDVPELKEGILQDRKLSTLSVVNKFNYVDLPKLYENPVIAQILPDIERMKISIHSKRAHDIAESVKYDIHKNGFCNVLNVCPIVLYCLCTRSLAQNNGSYAPETC